MTTTSDPATGAVADAAREHLRALAGPDAVLREDQLTAIRALVVDRARAVVVQRTGWGKSAVYWIATALRRADGAGPTLVVSPLLALMRDQVEAAGRMGLAAVTLNSANIEDWPSVEARIAADDVDVLLISPERLNSPGFRHRVLPHLGGRVGMVVIDEAHCISDWGFDFRPDYQRIRDVLAGLPPGTPVLATTATANARVTADVAEQLGTQTLALRGSLDRESLALDVVQTASAAERYAWIEKAVAALPGSGIIYTLTVAEAERLAAWLVHRGHAVRHYSGQIDAEERAATELALKDGTCKAVVATSALGMGFDHPTLAFVLHSGAPSSAVAYYQQVGRAGRALDSAVSVLLPGGEDAAIWEYFTSTAMPPEPVVRTVLEALEDAVGPVSLPSLESATGVRRGRLEALLKVLDVDGAVVRQPGGWERTAKEYVYDTERYARVAAARRAEQAAMLAYERTDQCLMAYLRDQLDDDGVPCGRCARCTGAPAVDVAVAADDTRAALAFLRSEPVVVAARKMWPSGLAGRRGRINPGLQDGRALALGVDAGWGSAVEAALARDEPIDDELLRGVVALLGGWGWPAGRPTWLCPIPSPRHRTPTADLAIRLGDIGRLPVVNALQRSGTGPFQETLETSRAAAEGALSALTVNGGFPEGPVLLLDDVSGSGWTLTAAAALLADAGAGPVYPLVLRRRP